MSVLSPVSGLPDGGCLRCYFNVIDRRVWFRDWLADLAHGLEVRNQGTLKFRRVSSSVSPAAAQPATSGE